MRENVSDFSFDIGGGWRIVAFICVFVDEGADGRQQKVGLAAEIAGNQLFVETCFRSDLRSRSTARYREDEPTFGDAIAGAVRRLLWSAPNSSMSRLNLDRVEIPTTLWEKLAETLCYAA